MTIHELTLFRDTPLYEYRLTLSGIEYRIRIDYSEREDRWFLYLFDAAGVLVCGPRKIVCGKPLLRYARWKPACPPGNLIALDMAGTRTSPGAEPEWADLGRRVRLFYDDLEEAA